MRQLVRLFILSAVAMAAAHAPTINAGARAKAAPSWKVDDNTYLQYKFKPAEKPDHFRAGIDPNYVHFMGYEIDEFGVLSDLSRPWVEQEVYFQLAAYVPAEKVRVGDTWEREWDFTKVSGTQRMIVNSIWKFTGLTDYEGSTCIHITGTHTLNDAADAFKPPCWSEFEMTTESWFDEEAGLLRGMKFDIIGEKIESLSSSPAPFTQEQEWVLATEIDTSETRPLKRQVDKAIERGVEALWGMRTWQGLWPHGSHERGGTALGLLALLMCGEDPTDKRIVESFKQLAEQEMETTYDVASSIMAYEALYITQQEREAFLTGDREVDTERKLSQEHFNEVQRLTDWLIENRNEPNVMWNYFSGHKGKPARYDFSVTQYALLGLQSAMRCKVAIPAGYIADLGAYVRRQQASKGPEIRRVRDFEPPKTDDKRKTRTSFTRDKHEALGWSYSAAGTWNSGTEATNCYGSMTCGGLTCMIAALDIAANLDEETHALEFKNRGAYLAWQEDGAKSVDAGFTWLEHWFSITRNPNKGRSWYFYYLYGLERVCMLADVRYLGAHDWYHEGAASLVTLQDLTGGWGSATDTAFALLFLKKGTVRPSKPVYTGANRGG